MDPFYDASCPQVFTILGCELKPFSIGHALFLRRLDCDPVQNLDQLQIAILICSNSWEDILPTLRNPWLPLRLKIWRWQIGPADVLGKIALFHSYLDAHSGRPILKENDRSGSIPGAPWLQHLRVSLMSRLGYSLSEAMNTCYAQCLWDYCTVMELEGRAEIAGEECFSMHDFANRMHEATLRAANSFPA